MFHNLIGTLFISLVKFIFYEAVASGNSFQNIHSSHTEKLLDFIR